MNGRASITGREKNFGPRQKPDLGEPPGEYLRIWKHNESAQTRRDNTIQGLIACQHHEKSYRNDDHKRAHGSH